VWPRGATLRLQCNPSIPQEPNRTLIVRVRAGTIAAVILLSSAACDRPKANRAAGDSSGRNAAEALAATTTRQDEQVAPYTSRELTEFGRATGFIQIDGPPPADTVVQPPLDQLVCGAAFTRRGIERYANRAVGVVVWIDGIRSGKPLPIERRFEIANDRCMLVPEVQTAIARGTLNVQNLDAAEHRTRITRQDGGEVVATIRETDEGQVVPNEHVLTRPGLLHLTCEVHTWTNAWIWVFDQPYFAMTGRDGSFTIDSIPPGEYKLHAWHPRLGSIEERITIEAGKTSNVPLGAKGRE